jgi:hypothetical protein
MIANFWTTQKPLESPGAFFMEYILMSRLENKTKGAALIFTACIFFGIAGILVKSGSYIGAYKLSDLS